MSYKDKRGRLHEGIEDAELADWIIESTEKKDEENKIEIFPRKISSRRVLGREVDPITGEIGKPEGCDGCCS